jgi:hypothetical protein
MKSKLTCPKCGSDNLSYNPWLGQIWTCQRCNYRGPVGLTEDGELSSKEKKIIEEVNEEIKNEKPTKSKNVNLKKYPVMVLAVIIMILMVGTFYGIIGGAILFLYAMFKDFF